MDYAHILVAAALTEHDAQIGDRALNLARLYNAQLSLVHVVENLPLMDSSYGPIVPVEVDLTQQLLDAARRQAHGFCAQRGIPESRCWIEIGSPKSEILRIAREQKVDLIVLGSHGRHGIGLLFGSTAASVVHHAECDVLAIRLRPAAPRLQE